MISHPLSFRLMGLLQPMLQINQPRLHQSLTHPLAHYELTIGWIKITIVGDLTLISSEMRCLEVN